MLINYDTGHCTIIGTVTLNDPQLGPLADNGGPTQTHALPAGSPAIDAGNAGGCRDSLGALLTADQRGFARTVDGDADGTAICDIGAYEFGASAPATPTPTATPMLTPEPCVGDCAGTGMVTINDLVLGVNIVLGDQPATACPAFEDPEGKVEIAQLVKGVRNALNGCGDSA